LVAFVGDDIERCGGKIDQQTNPPPIEMGVDQRSGYLLRAAVIIL
jgi:hypothetical protein